ncbi:MAG: hypothetical protein EOP39_22830 [Rubrivivax sp.]|nr:MAG: hypothetical protein EOP39_22830 [Rubrivivax sp.]
MVVTATVTNSNAQVLWSLSGPGTLSATSWGSTTYNPPGLQSLAEPAVARITATLGALTQAVSVNLTPAPSHQWVIAQPAMGALTAVIYADGQYYAGGDGEVLRSVDGIDWQSAYLGQPGRIHGLAKGANAWVAVGEGGMTAWSVDARTWSSGSYSGKPAQELFGAMAAGGGFVAWGLGDSGIYYSTDGKSWAAAETGGVTMLNGVSYGNGQFLAWNVDGRTLSSTDGIHWQPAVAPAACAWLSRFTAFNNGYFAIQGSQTCTSPDAQTWSASADATKGGLSGVDLFGTYGGTLYAGGQSNLWTSKDGLSWTQQWGGHVADGYQITGFASNGSSAVVTTDGRFAVSADLQSWITSPNALTTTVRAMDMMNGVIVALGADGSLAYSEDGKRWTTPATPSAPSHMSAIAHGLGTFVALDTGRADIYTSKDGKVWTKAPFNNGTPSAITFDGTHFVALGSNVAMKSTDGKTWQNSYFTPGPTGMPPRALTYGNGRYLATSFGVVYSSADGLAWTAQPTSLKEWWQGIANGPQGFVMVGGEGLIMSSTDGATWTQRTSGTTHRLNAITYANGQYIVVGDNGEILVSVDAVSWMRRAPTTGAALMAVCGDTGVFVAAGQGGIVLKSTQ